MAVRRGALRPPIYPPTRVPDHGRSDTLSATVAPDPQEESVAVRGNDDAARNLDAAVPADTAEEVPVDALPTSLPTRPLRIELLHEFRFLVDGRDVALSEGGQHLVAWLAVQDRPRSRSGAAATMWPERSDREASSSLRRALWRLNREAPSLVERDNHQVSLSRDVQVDLREVTRMADAVQEGALRGSAVTVRLLEGDLLPQWSFDWIDVHREALRQVRLHALEGLARNDLEADRPASALASALAAVGIDPLRESAHRIVIAVHLAEGNVAEALRQYTTYRDLLWKELRLRPGRQLKTMLPLDSGQPVRLETRRRSQQA